MGVFAIMTPNFTTMSTSALRLKVNATGVKYPCPNTPEAIALTQKAIREKLFPRS
jgi:predicted RNA-binding Zn-ribbon protein involved in translation (DUF1610 family)